MSYDEYDVKMALDKIIGDKKSYNTSLNYAINYTRAGLGMSGEELRVQCLYILSNLSSWRHPAAKEVRHILKTFSKQEIKNV